MPTHTPRSKRFTAPPVAHLIGFRMTAGSMGKAEGRMRIQRRHVGPSGAAHGGILCDLADAAMGIAFASTLHDGQAAVTVNLEIHFLRPVWRGQLTARARVIHRGRRLGLVECAVTNQAGQLVAQASSTCTVLSQPLAPPH